MQIRRLLISCFYILVIFNFLSHTAIASPTHLHIFHINGVNTSKEEAYNNRLHLEVEAKNYYQLVSWNILYNQTHGLIRNDLFDALRQKSQEHEDLSIYDYVDAYIKVHHLDYQYNSTDYRNLISHLKDFYAKDLDYFGRNFDDILKQYRAADVAVSKSIMPLLASQDRYHAVLFISHSQGCLYANSIIKYLLEVENFPAKLICLYAFANPASKLADSDNDHVGIIKSNYLTANNDFVINALRIYSNFSPVTDLPIRANIHLVDCHDSYLCHSLVDAYLANKNAIKGYTPKTLAATLNYPDIIAILESTIQSTASPRP